MGVVVSSSDPRRQPMKETVLLQSVGFTDRVFHLGGVFLGQFC